MNVQLKFTIFVGHFEVSMATCEFAMIVPMPIIVIVPMPIIIVVTNLKVERGWVAFNWRAVGERPFDDERNAIVALSIEGPIHMAMASGQND